MNNNPISLADPMGDIPIPRQGFGFNPVGFWVNSFINGLMIGLSSGLGGISSVGRAREAMGGRQVVLTDWYRDPRTGQVIERKGWSGPVEGYEHLGVSLNADGTFDRGLPMSVVLDEVVITATRLPKPIGNGGLPDGWTSKNANGMMASGALVDVDISDFTGKGLFKGGLKLGALFVTKSLSSAGVLAAKGGSQGGLNLFKWGEKTTTTANGWKAGDYMLHLPNKGTPALNWKANYGALRREMGLGNPIFETFVHPNGALRSTGGFLNAERFTLQSRGWIYNPGQRAWLPPTK